MIPDVIIGTTDNRYIIDNADKSKPPKPLGNGATGDVYAGAREDSPQDKVAIKIPHPGLPVSTLDDFRNEVATVKKIYERCGETKYVPWAELGRDPARPDFPIVILELVPKEWELRQLARDKKFDEALLLATGVQYVELLVIVLEELKMATYGDRKHGDPHWDAAHKRLVVLDWNRARELPNDKRQSADIKHQDIRIFAKLWTEMVLGNTIPDMLDSQRGSPKWLGLSLGTRTILARAYSQREDWRFKDAVELRDALKEHYANFQTAQSDPSGLIDYAKRLKKESANDRASLAALLIVADLVESHSSADPKQRKSAQEIAEWARGQIEKNRVDVAKKAEQIYQTIAKGQWGDAHKLAQTEIESVRGKSVEDQKAFLLLRRSFCLSQFAYTAFQAGFEKNPSYADIRIILAKTLKGFSFWESQDPASIDELERIRREFEILPDVPSNLANILQPIALEAQIRRLVIQAAQERGQNEKSANKIIDEAWSAWNSLNTADPLYAEALLATLTELAEHKNKNSNQAMRAKIFEDAQTQFRACVAAIERGATESPIDWDYTKRAANDAIRIYRGSLENPFPPIQSGADPRADEFEADYELMVDVGYICDARGTDADAALERALALDSRIPIRDELVNACAESAVKQLDDVVKHGKCPHELRKGQRLWALLYRIEQNGRSVARWDEVKPVSAKLGEWHLALDELRKKLLTDTWRDLDDPALDTKLAEWEGRIEIFDEWETGDAKDAPRQISHILAARRAEQVKRKLEQLLQQAQELEKKIGNGIPQLNTQIGDWNDTLGKITAARRVVPDDKFEGELTKMKAVANDLEQESKRLSSLEKWWKEQQSIVTKAQTEFEVWRNASREIDEAVIRINDTIAKITDESYSVARDEMQAIGIDPSPREKFVQAAKQTFKPDEQSLNDLEQIIEDQFNMEQHTGKPLSPRHLEAVAMWTGYLNEARRLKRKLDAYANRPKSQKLREDLENLPEEYSDPVFAVFSDIFTECLKKLGDDAVEMNQRVERKAVRGNKLLGRLSTNRTSEIFPDSAGSENPSLATEPPQE